MNMSAAPRDASMISPSLEHALETALHVVVFTGAGVSAESGVPTFRSAGGLWEKYDPHQLATHEAFSHDPDLVWSWYSWRRNTIRGVEPNPGHYAIAEAEQLFPQFTLVTQNVDNLHQRAGSRRVHELHGNIERSRCLACGTYFMGDEAPPTDKAQSCSCGGFIRPDVVWFGESLPMEELQHAQNAATSCDLLFTIGTAATVYPAAMLPVMARRAGAYVVEINPEPSSIAHEVSECITGASGVVFPVIIERLKQLRTTA